MLSFFVIATLVLCSVHAYLFFKLRHLFSSPQGRLLLLIFLILMLGLLLLRRREFYAALPDFVPWVAYTWLGFTLIALGCFLAYDSARLVFFLLKLVTGKELLPFLAPKFFTPIMLIAALGISGYAMYEARHLKLKHINIASPKQIGGMNKLRIVAVSDLHIGETIGSGDVDKWAAIIREQKPDLLVVVGDIIDTDMSMRDEEARLLRSIPTTYGTYAVLGNHEVYSGLQNSRNFIRRAGMILLENEADTSGPINIVGVNDPQVARFGDGEQPDVPALLQGVDQKKFTLLLKHQPVFQDGETGLFDLQISGHTHGGQIWPGRYLVRRIFGFKQGLTLMRQEKNNSLLYLMNGTGYWGPPMRFLARPEIIVFDISGVDRSGASI